MKKKLILIDVIFLVITILLSLVFNAISFQNSNDQNARSELQSYIAIATNSYNGANEDEVIHLFDNAQKKIRITIIDFDGNVKADSSKEEVTTNHLYREEIRNPGTFVSRKSATLGIEMLYLAKVDNGSYVRVAVEIAEINSNFIMYFLTNGVSSLIILAICILILTWILKNFLKPLSSATKRLENLTNNPSDSSSDSLEDLVKSIELASLNLGTQMSLLKKEKEKVINIINSINQGLIILDANLNVDLINNYALSVLELKLNNILHKNYIYCFRNQEINKAIENLSLLSQPIDLFANGYTYQITMSKFDEKTAILLTDITTIKNLDNMKREFFQNASHELKSPLTSIIGYQQMIKEGIITDDKEIKNATVKTIIEATRMNNIIVEMLELSKFESQIDEKKEDVLVGEIISEVVSSFNGKALLKNITINVTTDKTIINTNRENLFTLIKNIVDNAIKYNKDNGSICIVLNDKKLTIEDSGIGIEQKNISRIFERFYRVDKAKSKELGSTGLGLAIVKHICKMYGYDISVSSTLGIGTKFTITFQ